VRISIVVPILVHCADRSDLLQIDGKDLRKAPLIERRQALADLLAGHLSRALRYSEHFNGDGAPSSQRQ